MQLATSKNLTILGVLTILGALVAAAVPLLDGNPATNPNWEALGAALTAGMGMIMAKGQANTGGTIPSTPEAVKRVTAPPAVIALLVGAALFFATPARAQDVTPAPVAPLAVQLSPDLSLHLNVTVPAFGYSITQRKFLGQVTFGLAYVLDYRELVSIGGGGGYVQTNDAPGLNLQAMIGGPVLPYVLGSLTKIRPAALYQYKWLGGVHEQIVAGTLALQF